MERCSLDHIRTQTFWSPKSTPGAAGLHLESQQSEPEIIVRDDVGSQSAHNAGWLEGSAMGMVGMGGRFSEAYISQQPLNLLSDLSIANDHQTPLEDYGMLDDHLTYGSMSASALWAAPVGGPSSTTNMSSTPIQLRIFRRKLVALLAMLSSHFIRSTEIDEPIYASGLDLVEALSTENAL